MRALPSGTVTLLFTDIEGSTRLLREFGEERFNEALSEHRRVLREAFAAHNGVELGTEGDSFFAAFASAQDAVAAAARAQEALASLPLCVRIGIHTGEPLPVEHEGGYVGLDVHRAARIMASGHGRQTLLSEATRELLASSVVVVDLGEHRLKDLLEPIRLYQLGDTSFPPIRTLNQTNLPIQPTALVGRERELGDTRRLLRRHRLVTLTGPGGSGKTRLALQLAAELVDEFADGVWFVSLAALRDQQLVLPTVAATLGLTDSDTLGRYLGDKRALLLLDNFEQVVDAGTDVAELLRNASQLRLLITSREPLHVSGEQEYPVPPLHEEEAVTLFAERARSARPAFDLDEHVAEICRRLDNLPLAIELASARVKVLTPAQILERLEKRFELLTGGARDAPERQRTLRATIEWSYELLEENERELLARLSVFAGGFELDAAELVADADVDAVLSLIDKSLLRRTETGRLFLLETIRQYATEKLSRSVAEETRRRHAQLFAALAEEAAKGMVGADAAAWARRTRTEFNNLRAALAWAANSGDSETEVRIIVALRQFWRTRGDSREGLRAAEQALGRISDSRTELRAKALRVTSTLASNRGLYEQGLELAEQSLALAKSLGDYSAMARALNDAGIAALMLGQYDRARFFHERCGWAARHAGDTLYEAISIEDLGDLALNEGNYETAERLLGEGMRLLEELEASDLLVIASYNLASAAFMNGRVEPAERLARRALRLAAELENSIVAGFCLSLLAAVRLSNQDLVVAARLVGASEALIDQAGSGFFGGLERRLHDDNVAQLQERLGKDAFARERALGRDDVDSQISVSAKAPVASLGFVLN